ncbi:MAG: SpoIIE family protein phosphatase [bacterium]
MLQTKTISLDNKYLLKKDSIKYDFLIIGLIGFFMGQAEMGSTIFPFSLIYWSLFFGRYNKLVSLAVTLSTGLGLVVTGDLFNLLYIIAGITGYIIYYLFRKRLSLFNLKDSFILISSIYIVFSFIRNYYEGALLYQYIFNFGEGCSIFLVSSILKEGIKSVDWENPLYTRCEKLTFLFLSSGFFIGLAHFPLLSGYKSFIINIIVLSVIILIGYYKGVTSSVLLATGYGLFLYGASIITVESMIKYSIVGLVVGFFDFRKKIWLFPCLFISFLLFSGFAPDLYIQKKTVLEFIWGGFLFVLFSFVARNIGEYFITQESSEDEEINEKQEVNISYVNNYLNDLSNLFFELSNVFSGTALNDDKEEDKRIDDFVFLFKNKNCQVCSRNNVCWHCETEETRNIIEKLARVALKKNKLSKEMIEECLKGSCPHHKKYMGNIKEVFALFQLNNFWRDYLVDKQQMVSKQLAGVGETIKQINGDQFPQYVKQNKIADIKSKIEYYGLKIYDFRIFVLKEDMVTIEIEMEPCARGNPCENKVHFLLDEEFSHDFRLLEKSCGNKLKDSPCVLKYSPGGDFQLEVAVRQKACQNVSGDCYAHERLNDGQDILILSDGMGSGKKAARESRTAIALFADLVRANVKKDLAIEIINSSLFLRNQKENFTTLDICIFDTFTGQMEMRKLGAVSSFIKRGWEVEEISSASPPAGILRQVEISYASKKLKKDDFLIMLSDGVLESRKDIENKEEWFKQLVINTSFNRPGDLADYILDSILETENEIRDDLTVMVSRVNMKKS